MTSPRLRPGPKIVFLMYHELEVPGRPTRQVGPASEPFLLPVASFRAQMQALHDRGIKGLSVSEAIRYPAEPSVCITFDDGYASDWSAAAPVLEEFGFHATSFIPAGFVGAPGHLTASEVRQLRSAGVEVGCHSMTHAALTEVSDRQLAEELGAARVLLEDLVGEPVEHFAWPYGRYDHRTLVAAGRAAFRTLSTCRPYANSLATHPFELGRVPISRGQGLPEFVGLTERRHLLRLRVADELRSELRVRLGAVTFDVLRGAVRTPAHAWPFAPAPIRP